MRVVVYSAMLPGLGGGEKYGLMMLLPLVGRADITVCYTSGGGFDPAEVGRRFALDLPGVRYAHCHSDRAVLRAARGADLFLNVTYASLLPNPARAGLLMTYFPVPIDDGPAASRRPAARAGRRLEAARQAVLARIADQDPDALAGGFAAYRRAHGPARAVRRLPLFLLRKAAWVGYRDSRLGAAALATYDRLVCCSRFGADWAVRYYGRAAEVLYPPIDVAAPERKANEVLAAGRFDDGVNSKKYAVLVDSFRRLHAGPLAGWTLHLCGAVHGRESEEHLADLRRRAAGCPIEFHPNAPHAELASRYAAATLFWHAMGHGVDADREPWRCEHFGMTTAEAMSAGCVPMVVDAGGQREIVAGRGCGYVWRTTDDLDHAVRDFLSLPAPGAAALAQAARRRAADFSRAAFLARVCELYRELNVAHDPSGGANP